MFQMVTLDALTCLGRQRPKEENVPNVDAVITHHFRFVQYLALYTEKKN